MDLITPPQSAAVLSGNLFQRLWYLFFDGLQQRTEAALQTVQQGTHAARLATSPADVPDGALWIETDRGGLVYQARNSGTLGWFYVSGMYSLAQANIAAFAATLGTNDTGLRLQVTDYAHVLQWTGAGWAWGPGEEGGGSFQAFAAAPTGAGWHACDGTTAVHYLKSDGTLGAVDLPDTAGSAAYIKLGGAYAKTITAAQAPTVTQPTFTGNALATHQHEESVLADAGAIYSFNSPFGHGPSRTVTGGVVVAAPGPAPTSLTSGVSAGTPSGTVSQPTASLPGDPVAHFQALLYFRQ